MKDIALHLLDVLENSPKAGASKAIVSFSYEDSILSIKIEDNGPGFPKIFAHNPSDPYATTRKERKVGLGLALLSEACLQTGGKFETGVSKLLGGAMVDFSFDMSHPDSKPLGEISGVLSEVVTIWESVDWIFLIGENFFNSVDIKKELDGIPLNTPEVLKFIRQNLEELFSPLKKWATSIQLKI